MDATIQLPEDTALALRRLCARRGLSTEDLLRLAVETYLSREAFGDSADRSADGASTNFMEDTAVKAAFGSWKDRDIDGVEYQRKLRAEWDERDVRSGNQHSDRLHEGNLGCS
jgi:hypothetical protein